MNGYYWALLTATISGFSIFINKFVMEGDPFAFTTAKNIAVAALFVALVIFTKEYKTIYNLPRKHLRNLVIIGIMGGSIPFLLFFCGLSITSAPKAAFLHKTMFIFVAIFAYFFLAERLSKKQIIATALLFFGVFLAQGDLFEPDFGALLIFLAVLFWSAEQIVSKYVLRELSPNVVAFGRMFFGSLIMFAFLGLIGRWDDFLFSGSQLIWILIPIAFLFLYNFTWYRGLQKIKAAEATAILVLGSAITTMLDFTYSGRITPEKLAGVLLILISVILIIYTSQKLVAEVGRWTQRQSARCSQ